MHKIPKRILLGLAALLLLLLVVALLAWELLSSAVEARFLARTAERMTYEVRPGPSERIRFPGLGPYDQRLGYSSLPNQLVRLQQQGWEISDQARVSVQMARVADLGLFLPYPEKDQSGLTLLDSTGKALYQSRHPSRVYDKFEAIPKVLVDSLLYIENRELLTEQFPTRNPAVEWDRLAQALLEKGISLIDRDRNVPGGSTLPTQIEKYRHSPEGLTAGMGEKLQQMATASLRAYLQGPNTLPMRRRIVMAYLNTVPLAAAPRFGEVHGIGDGLWAWYGIDFATLNQTLSRPPLQDDPDYASALKHALSLIVSVRRPSYYLATNRKALDALTDDHLELLAGAGIIPRELAERAKQVKLRGPADRVDPPPPRFVEQKATNAQRNRLASLLGIPQLYDLDRLDLQAHTTINQAAQKQVGAFLQSLDKPEAVAAAGLIGHRLLKPDNDFSKVIYSFTLYEKAPTGIHLRVQADNLNQPFDINSQARLDLGSTAKLRTLVTYLEIISRLHADHRKLDKAALQQKAQPQRDVLSQWVATILLDHPDIELADLLNGAMSRQYSAAPEAFFTGGGVHHFANFDVKDNSRVMDVWEATRNSVNLVFIRIMRDIVRHYASHTPGAAARILDDASNPLRQSYLARFVDQEGRLFINRFYQRHKNLTAAQREANLYERIRLTPRRFAAVYRYLDQRASYKQFVAALQQQIPTSKSLTERVLQSLYEEHAPDAYTLADRGYIAQIHPLELWLVQYLRSFPQADLKELIAASAEEREAVYKWLFKTSRKNAQDIRIQSLLEVEAFDKLLLDWKRLGYPFDSITPSYATAIGSSGDRPAALAELMSVLVNDGVRIPTTSLTQLHFAVGTPYETRLARKPPPGERLLPAELAQTVRLALAQVVERGTAVRLAGSLKDDAGEPVVIGGKTGTGDHRFERFGAGGQLLESRVVNRTATFVFYLGERYFGTLTALVPGEQAGKFEFTSSLTVQLLKMLLPQLRPHLFPQGIPAAAKPLVEPAPQPAPVVAREKPEGATSQASPPPVDKMPSNGFPEDLEPSTEMPFPEDLDPPRIEEPATPAAVE